MAQFCKKFKVRFADVDYAKVVYYPRILDLFHQAFEDMFAHYGVDFAAMIDEQRIGFPVVHAEIDFVHPLRFGDEFQICLQVKEIGPKKIVFYYEGFQEKTSQLIARATIAVVCIHMDSFKAREIPASFQEIFRQLAN